MTRVKRDNAEVAQIRRTVGKGSKAILRTSVAETKKEEEADRHRLPLREVAFREGRHLQAKRMPCLVS